MKTKLKPKTAEENFEADLLRLRRCVGVLGLLLPTLMLGLHQKLLASMSHYYYTSSSIFFTGILFAFGLVLMAYRGYQKDSDERFSDDQLTTWAGLFALATVIIPTSCYDSGDTAIVCKDGYLLGHCSMGLNTLHLISAGLFIIILGWMCIYKFTRSTKPESMEKHRLYKICGFTIWGAVGSIGILIAIEKIFKVHVDDYLFGYVFILEAVALYAFAIAWLVKGKIERDIKKMSKKIFGS